MSPPEPVAHTHYHAHVEPRSGGVVHEHEHRHPPAHEWWLVEEAHANGDHRYHQPVHTAEDPAT